MLRSTSEDRDDMEEREEREEESQRMYRTSSHPLTPSAGSHGRTVILPWQTPYLAPSRGVYQGDTSGPGLSYRGRERAEGGRYVDMDNDRDRERERDRDREGEGVRQAGRYHRGGVTGTGVRTRDAGRDTHPMDYLNDNEAENASHSSQPSVQSQLTTDTETLINRERDRGDRERVALGGYDIGTGTGTEPERGRVTGEKEGGKDKDKGGYDRKGDRYG